MATPPTPFQLRANDFPAAPAQGFVTPFNTQSRQTAAALAKGLTFSDNSNVEFKTFGVPGGVPATSYTVSHGLSGRCTGLMVWNVVASTTGLGVTIGTVNAQWVDNGDGTISVYNLGTLSAGPDYQVTLALFGEPL